MYSNINAKPLIKWLKRNKILFQKYIIYNDDKIDYGSLIKYKPIKLYLEEDERAQVDNRELYIHYLENILLYSEHRFDLNNIFIKVPYRLYDSEIIYHFLKQSDYNEDTSREILAHLYYLLDNKHFCKIITINPSILYLLLNDKETYMGDFCKKLHSNTIEIVINDIIKYYYYNIKEKDYKFNTLDLLEVLITYIKDSAVFADVIIFLEEYYQKYSKDVKYLEVINIIDSLRIFITSKEYMLRSNDIAKLIAASIRIPSLNKYKETSFNKINDASSALIFATAYGKDISYLSKIIYLSKYIKSFKYRKYWNNETFYKVSYFRMIMNNFKF